MPNKTPSYQLTQPLVTEAYDVNQFNENASIIDTELKSLSDKIDNIDVGIYSGILVVPTTGWYPVSSPSQESTDGAAVYLDIPLAGVDTTEKVHGELTPETRQAARDAGMLDYTRVVMAGMVRVYAVSIPAAAVQVQYTRMPAETGEVDPVGYIAGLTSDDPTADDIMESNALSVEVNQRNQDAEIALLWDALFNDITTNPFLITFASLDGITLSEGIWNQAQARIEC